MNVGYSSTDPAQVKRQINDMISRGIDGVVMVWYGPNNAIDRAAQLVMNEAEAHPGFNFALMVDHGAILWDSCSGCSPQQALTEHLKYIEQTYFSSPAYLRFNGQPLITNFDIDLFYNIDWGALKAALSSNPAFIFQNTAGFTHADSEGAYSWVMPTLPAYGTGYLASFYHTGIADAGSEYLGAAYKGFNDTLASWGMNRVMGQQCGQTWLQTFSEINGLYDSGNQLPAMQLVTWNDYEEGTEIESGIDNCVSVVATVSGNSLNWDINSNENTVDHYSVFVSTDGQNLMPLQDEAVGTHSLDMCSYSLASSNYKLYVQAVGRPSMKNQISGAVAYTPQCISVPPLPLPTTIALNSSPSAMTIVRGEVGNSSVVITPQSGAFNNTVSLSCSNLPAGMACSFFPSDLIPGSGPAISALTISTTSVSSSLRHGPVKHGEAYLFAYWISFPLTGIVVVGGVQRKYLARFVALVALTSAIVLLSSCGISTAPASAKSPIRTPATYQITINAVSGAVQATTVTSITVQ
jgi:hypothetical protein